MKLFKKVILIFCGSLCVLLGIIGLILPVMPSTIFFMVAGLCYINSSKTLYNRLIKMSYIGPTIESYVERKEVTRKFKIYSMLFLTIPTIVTQIFIVEHWISRVVSLLLLILVAWHILSLKTVDKAKIVLDANKKDDR
jgi:hypothetical protein